MNSLVKNFNKCLNESMRRIFPPKLKAGDLIRCITPSQSLEIVKKEQQERARERLESLGLRVDFGKHVHECDEFSSSSIKARIEDIHEAFADKEVKGVLAIEGGFNSNQLLDYLDWDLIRRNPKFFEGYSDTTVLNNAFLARAGLVTYSGPLFSSFGQKKNFEYTLDYFRKCVMEQGPYEIKQSDFWVDDDWEADQDKINPVKNAGPVVINEGKAEGIIIGGNMSSIGLLQGTKYMPDWRNSVLFVEDDYEWQAHHFDRCFQSLLQQKDFWKVKAVVWGRCDRLSKISDHLMWLMNKTKRELKNIPVVANVDFGHTTPKFTFPVGGKIKLEAKGAEVKLTLLEH